MLKFKIGDTVRITHFPDSSLVGLKCKVIHVDTQTGYKFPYRVKGVRTSGIYSGRKFDLPMMEREIASAIKIGEQLLLFEL